MKKIIIALVAIAVLVGGFLYFTGTKQATKNDTAAPIAEDKKPWIEVLTPPVFEMNSNNEVVRELKTGDEVGSGSIVSTNAKAQASLYFADGSVLRVDSETKLALDQALFQSKDGSLLVKTRLLGGRVWSKIISLATPQSVWEVKTTNAVATVRGSAFGMEFKNKKSTIIGSEHTILVRPINQKTGEIMEEEEVLVEEKTFMIMGDDDIAKLTADQRVEIQTRPMTKVLIEDVWVRNNEKSDQETIKRVEEVKASGLEKDALYERIREQIYEEHDIIRPEIDAEKTIDPTVQPEATRLPSVTIEPAKEIIRVTATPIPATTKEVPTPVSISITTTHALGTVSEGETITFQATLIFSNGEKKNITAEASWKVLGGIGIIEKPGIFLARLDSSVSELGTVPGSVAVSWTDLGTRKTLEASSPLFKVTLAKSSGTEVIGGQ